MLPARKKKGRKGGEPERGREREGARERERARARERDRAREINLKSARERTSERK